MPAAHDGGRFRRISTLSKRTGGRTPTSWTHSAMRRRPSSSDTADCFDQFVVSYPKATCRVVQSADLVFANLVEYEMIVRMCGTITTPMVVKKGELGADYRFGSESVTTSAPAVQLVDPTGAGDAFAGAYLANLARGADQRDGGAVDHAHMFSYQL